MNYLSPLPLFDDLLSQGQLSCVWKNWFVQVSIQLQELKHRVHELEQKLEVK